MTSQYCKLPLNSMELIDAVKSAAGADLALDINSPDTVVSELLEQKSKGRLLLHLLNYGVEQTPLVKAIAVGLKVPDDKKVSGISLLSPDEDRVQALPYTMERGRLRFTVPQLQTNSIAIVQMEQ